MSELTAAERLAEALIESSHMPFANDYTLSEGRSALLYLDDQAHAADLRIKKIAEAKKSIKRAVLGEDEKTRRPDNFYPVGEDAPKRETISTSLGDLVRPFGARAADEAPVRE